HYYYACCHRLFCLTYLSYYTLPPSPPSTLSLHDALPICGSLAPFPRARIAPYVTMGIFARQLWIHGASEVSFQPGSFAQSPPDRDRKSTRLNSSHLGISYAVFCLKKKKDSI